MGWWPLLSHPRRRLSVSIACRARQAFLQRSAHHPEPRPPPSRRQPRPQIRPCSPHPILSASIVQGLAPARKAFAYQRVLFPLSPSLPVKLIRSIYPSLALALLVNVHTGAPLPPLRLLPQRALRCPPAQQRCAHTEVPMSSSLGSPPASTMPPACGPATSSPSTARYALARRPARAPPYSPSTSRTLVPGRVETVGRQMAWG